MKLAKRKSLNSLAGMKPEKTKTEKLSTKKNILIIISLLVATLFVIILCVVIHNKKVETATKEAEQALLAELRYANVEKVAVVGGAVSPYIEARNKYQWRPTKQYNLSEEDKTDDGIPDENIIDIYKTTTNKIAYVHYHNATILEVKMFDTLDEAKQTVRKLMYAKVQKENEKILNDSKKKNIQHKGAPEAEALVRAFKPGMTHAEFKTEREKYDNVYSAATFKTGIANTAYAVVVKEGFVLIITSPDGIEKVKPIENITEALEYVKENYIIDLDDEVM